MFVENLRGRLRTLPELDPYFQAIEPGQFSLIVLDALYRLLPSDTSENDNAAMAGVFNRLDRIAVRLAGHREVSVDHLVGDVTNPLTTM